jgi:hypothetical protein
MENISKVLNIIDKEHLTKSEILSIIEIACTKIDIDTISGMARKEGKTPRGIKTSNQYRKVKIGSQLMAVKGLKETDLPF